MLYFNLKKKSRDIAPFLFCLIWKRWCSYSTVYITIFRMSKSCEFSKGEEYDYENNSVEMEICKKMSN